ncbi:MAG: hypothetical protein U0169_26950 [Polyangiaceae bacterium]
MDDDADLAEEMGRVLATRGHGVDHRFDADSAFEALSDPVRWWSPATSTPRSLERSRPLPPRHHQLAQIFPSS